MDRRPYARQVLSVKGFGRQQASEWTSETSETTRLSRQPEHSATIKLLAMLPVARADSCSHVSAGNARRTPRMDMLLAAVRVCDWVGPSDWDGRLWQRAQRASQLGDSLSNPRRQHPPRAVKKP